MKPSISEAEFDELCKRCVPVPLTTAQKSDLYTAYAHLEAMRELVRKPRSHTAEPAHIFVVTQSGGFDAE